MRCGRETATAVGWAVNSVSAPARTNSLTSGSGSGAGGSVLGCRRIFGTKVAYWSAISQPANSTTAQAITLIAILVAGIGKQPWSGGWKATLPPNAVFFCERSARPRRRAVNLARGRCAPLAAVRPRLLRTGRGDRSRRRSGGLERGANEKPIALGSGRGGVCLGLGSDGSGRSGVGLYLRIGGERRHHGSADCKRGHASYEPKDGHLTTHPAAPVAPRTRSGVLGVSRGGETKGSRSKARFPAHFPVKMRHPGKPGAKSAADQAQNGRNRRGRRGFGARAGRVERPRNRSALVEHVEKVSPVRPIRIEAALPPHAGGLEAEISCLLRGSLRRVLAQERPHPVAASVCVRRRGQHQRQKQSRSQA